MGGWRLHLGNHARFRTRKGNRKQIYYQGLKIELPKDSDLLHLGIIDARNAAGEDIGL